MISARSMPGSNFSIDALTASATLSLCVNKIDCAISSCSAWANKSIATQSGSTESSAITNTSDGPAIISMPTRPNTCFFAVATKILPGPVILSTAGIVFVP